MTGGVSPQGVMNKRPGMVRVGAKGRNSRAGCNGRREPPGSVCQRPIEEGFRGRGVRGAYGSLAPASKAHLDGMAATGFAAVPARSTRAAPAKADGARQIENSRACLVRLQGQLLHDVKIVAGNRRVKPEKPPESHPIPKAPSGDGHFRWRMHGSARIIAPSTVF